MTVAEVSSCAAAEPFKTAPRTNAKITVNSICAKFLFIDIFLKFQKLKIKMASYKKNLDFRKKVQKSVIAIFVKLFAVIRKIKQIKVVTKIKIAGLGYSLKPFIYKAKMMPDVF